MAVNSGSLAQSKAHLTVSPIFLRRFSYQASPYPNDDVWRNITARCRKGKQSVETGQTQFAEP